MRKKKKLLFISHYATLTGAPVLLLNLIKLLKVECDVSIRIIIKHEQGELIDDFRSVGDVLIWNKIVAPTLFKRISKRVLLELNIAGKANIVTRKNDKLIQEWIDESDFVISNTITNGDFLSAFNFTKTKVICYAHELEIATHIHTSKRYLATVINRCNLFMVPSRAVANHLIHNLGISEDRIAFLNYYIPFDTETKDAEKKYDKKFVVGMAGTLDWRKGADLFPIIASSFFSQYPEANVLFVWKGVEIAHTEYTQAMNELKKLNLIDKVILEEVSKDVRTFYHSIDVLLLTSREDPYPLVVLEAARHHKCCICFEGAGGAPEFVENNAGTITPYLNIQSMVEAIHLYNSNTDKCRQDGINANLAYERLHLNKELIISQFNSAMEKACLTSVH